MKPQSLTTSILLALLASLLLFSAAAAALSGPDISWAVVAAGGGQAMGGNIEIQGTLGQPIVDNSFGGAVSLNAGYWVPISAQFRVFLPAVSR